MNRPDFVIVLQSYLRENYGVSLSRKELEDVVKFAVEVITTQLSTGEEFSIAGLGKLVRKVQASCTRVNPSSPGTKVQVPEKYRVAFRPSSILKGIISSIPVETNE